MTGRADELRAARLLFERAMAAGVSLDECRRREAQARWEAAAQRLTARTAAPVGEEARAELPLQWWQR